MGLVRIISTTDFSNHSLWYVSLYPAGLKESGSTSFQETTWFLLLMFLIVLGMVVAVVTVVCVVVKKKWLRKGGIYQGKDRQTSPIRLRVEGIFL